MKHYDIVIIGGGMVGAALACALQNTAFRVALIDAGSPQNTDDHRLIALNHSSYTLLKNLAIWPTLAPHAAAIHRVHVSHRRHFGSTCLNASEVNLPELGYVVPAKEINSALYKKLNQLSNLDVISSAKLTDLQQQDKLVTLTTDRQSLTATLVISADGTSSTVRKNLDIPTETINYQQKALVTVTTLQRPHQQIAYERFLASGAIAMLPLTQQRAATIWSDDVKHIDELLALSDELFLKKLQEQFGYRLGKLQAIAQRYSYPLQFVKAKENVKHRVILIGNAAHTMHPIAAQGLNLAFYEIAMLAEQLAAQSPDSLSLDKLPANRQQSVSMNLSHRLTQIFSSDFFILNTARQLGMMGLDVCTQAKQHFIARALGKTGHVPALLIENN